MQTPESISVSNAKELLKLWHLRALRATRNHRHAAEVFERRESRLTRLNTTFGVLVVALSGISIAIDSGIHVWGFLISQKLISVTLTLASATVLVTSITQLIFAYGSRSVRVEWLASDYGALVRLIEESLLSQNTSPMDIQKL